MKKIPTNKKKPATSKASMECLVRPITDKQRMDWLVSMCVEVRTPCVYGSLKLFTAQTVSDEEDEHHATSLRDQIDREIQRPNAKLCDPESSTDQKHS